MIIQLIMLGYFSILVKRLFLHEEDTIVLMNQMQDLDKMGKINYSDINSVFNLLILDAKKGENYLDAGVKYDDDAKKYINITFEEIERNNFKKLPPKAVQFRKCQSSDFNQIKGGENLYIKNNYD